MQLFGYNDAGASLGPVLLFTRATGAITFDPNQVYPNAFYRMNQPFFAQSAFGQTTARVMVSGSTMTTTSINPYGIAQNIAWSGVLDTGQPTFNSIVSNDTITVSQSLPSVTQLAMTHNYNAGATSSRTQAIFLFNKNAASADGKDGSPANLGCFMHYDVGDSTNPLSPLGRASCVNFDGRIGGTGIAAIALLIQENDIRLYAGNTAVSKVNLDLHNAIGDAAHGTVEDVSLAFTASPLIAPGTGGCKTMISIGRSGNIFPFDPLLSGTAVMQAIPSGLGNIPNAFNPAVSYGIDLTGLNFTAYAWRSTGFWVDGTGQIPVMGPGAVTYNTGGLQIDVPNMREVSATVAAGGTGYKINDVITDSIGGLWTVTGISGNAATTVSLLKTGYSGSTPTNPVATSFGGGSGLTLNVTTAATGTLTLNPSGDTIIGKGLAGAVGDTKGHLLIPFVSGTPTGVPANASKGIALRYDTTAHKLWVYDTNGNTWRGVVLT